jgi:hypothetical protein
MCIRLQNTKCPVPGLGHRGLSGQVGQGMVNLILIQPKTFIQRPFHVHGVGSLIKCHGPT